MGRSSQLQAHSVDAVAVANGYRRADRQFGGSFRVNDCGQSAI